MADCDTPSPQLVARCLLEGCRPVPVDAVVCGRCETCAWDRHCTVQSLAHALFHSPGFGCANHTPSADLAGPTDEEVERRR